LIVFIDSLEAFVFINMWNSSSRVLRDAASLSEATSSSPLSSLRSVWRCLQAVHNLGGWPAVWSKLKCASASEAGWQQLRSGQLVGQDYLGNTYWFNPNSSFFRRRWVEPTNLKEFDASSIPPLYHRWLHDISDDFPPTVDPVLLPSEHNPLFRALSQPKPMASSAASTNVNIHSPGVVIHHHLNPDKVPTAARLKQMTSSDQMTGINNWPIPSHADTVVDRAHQSSVWMKHHEPNHTFDDRMSRERYQPPGDFRNRLHAIDVQEAMRHGRLPWTWKTQKNTKSGKQEDPTV